MNRDFDSFDAHHATGGAPLPADEPATPPVEPEQPTEPATPPAVNPFTEDK